MSIDITIIGSVARIKISDRFDSTVYKDFVQAYMPLVADAKIQTIEVDVSGTEYLDSAALGMLVQLNESAQNARKSIMLISVPGRVADVLKIANADKLFSIKLPSGMKLSLRE